MDVAQYAQYHETKRHETAGFPYNTYLCTIPQDFDRVPPHWHEQMEVIYIKRGSGAVWLDFERLPVGAGSIVPVMPGEIHAIEGDPGGRMEYENVIFSLDILDSRVANDWCRDNVLAPLREASLAFERPLPEGSELYRQARAALDAADEACRTHESGYSLVVKSSLFLLLDALYAHRDPAPRRPRRHTERLKAVLEEVRLHYDRPLTVADAARIAGYSEAHLMRVFRQETGLTFTAYLTEYRLEAAAYYLEKTDERVADVAVRCGFQNLSYFNRRFRERYQTTPSAWRRSHRGD